MKREAGIAHDAFASSTALVVASSDAAASTSTTAPGTARSDPEATWRQQRLSSILVIPAPGQRRLPSDLALQVRAPDLRSRVNQELLKEFATDGVRVSLKFILHLLIQHTLTRAFRRYSSVTGSSKMCATLG